MSARDGMNFGCHLPMYGPVATRQGVLAFARRIEQLGYHSLWASDHVVIPHRIAPRYPYSATGEFPLAPDVAFLEPLATLALVAGATERVELGTTVLVLPHRHPLLAAKTLATLDHLSGGRLILGVGVGWMREEIEMLGAPFESRGSWSDEAIEVMRACWREAAPRHRGQHFAFDEIGVYPKPARDIPIWIGGHTPRALKRVVALGDGWHAAFPTVQELEQGTALVRAECERQGRRFDDLSISVRAGLSIRNEPLGGDRRAMQGTPEQIIDDVRRYGALGVDTIVLETRARELDDMLAIYERFAREIRPRA